jgi:hypothetical protein
MQEQDKLLYIYYIPYINIVLIIKLLIMKYKLNVLDRLIIPNLLPKEGSIVEQTTAKEIRDKVHLQSSDFKKYGLVEYTDPKTGGKAFTNDSVDPDQNKKLLEEIDVDFSKTHTEVLKAAASKLDDAKKVTPFNLDTVLKIKDMRG